MNVLHIPGSVGIALLAFIAVTARGAAFAEDLAAEARAERPQLRQAFPAAFAPVTDIPNLPNVLLIGDSISIGYTPPVRELLRGVANVHRVPDNAGWTARGLSLLDEWLASRRWDVIHFNFGLHDVAQVNADAPRTPLADYERNLRAIVERLRATGARLIFATSTPVPDGPVRPRRANRDVLARNAAAREIMAGAGVTINDLYALASPRLAEIQQPVNVHFTDAGYRELAAQVAHAIRGELAPQAGR